MSNKPSAEDEFNARTESQVRAMLHVVPEGVRKGSYQTARNWKDTVMEANKALAMAPGIKRTGAIGRVHIALCAMGGGNS